MYTFTIENDPQQKDVEALGNGLRAHSLPHTLRPGFLPLACFLRDDDDQVVGGMWGYVNWNWLYIGLVWVADELRGKGYGKELLERLEAAGRERGCVFAHLDTFSYQARPFYEKMGYEVFATLEDYPPGHQRYFMKKAL